MGREIAVILDNVRSAYNVGSIFRTAECAGVEKIYLCGYTPSPLGKNLEKIAKVSLGAERSLSWVGKCLTWQTMEFLEKEGYFIIALENKAFGLRKRGLFTFNSKRKKVALVLGNEVKGLSKRILGRAGIILEIPLFGKKESLNVSVAFGIAAYWLRGQEGKS